MVNNALVMTYAYYFDENNLLQKELLFTNNVTIYTKGTFTFFNQKVMLWNEHNTDKYLCLCNRWGTSNGWYYQHCNKF